MSRAVRFEQYGDVDVLQVVDVDPPVAGAGEVLVRVRAAGINPGEAKIRAGLLHARFPATFPSGQGSDLAGVVEAVGDGVSEFAIGDEVLGYTDTRSSHAELAAVPVSQLTAKPAGVSWEAAGSLFVAGSTGYAMVHAVGLSAGDTVVVSGAAGGVGSIAVQLARRAGAEVIGLASERNHPWLRSLGVTPVSYGEAVADRIRDAAPHGVNALLDTVGGGYVDLGLELGVAPERIDTIVDFAAASRGVKTEGAAAGASAEVLAELAALIDSGELEVPIAATYRLDEVRAAFAELAGGHTHGKIVLTP